ISFIDKIMRLLFIPFILLSLVCFGQKSTDYIIDIKYGSNDQLQTSRTTYLTLTKNNSSSKKEFPYEAIVNGIVYKEPQRSYHFSSIHPDSNQNITSSSVLIDILYLLNRPIRFDIRNNEILLDTSAIQADITDQLNQWELKED